jgi:hypothetical protein
MTPLKKPKKATLGKHINQTTTTMTPHDDYIKEKSNELQSTALILIGMHDAISSYMKRFEKDDFEPLPKNQIYEDGYRDGYDERQSLGDLN